MNDPGWERVLFKGNKVYVRVDASGNPVLDSRGLAVMRYNVQDSQEYNASPRDLTPLTPDVLEALERRKAIKRRKTSVLTMYTAGSVESGQGPAGAGIVLLADGYRREICLYFARATHNVVELVAVREALMRVKDRNRKIRLAVESAYVKGVLSGDWEADANRTLIHEVRALMKTFPALELVKIRQQARDELNALACRLAARAREERQGSDQLQSLH